jgi:hypothetical protein
MRDIVPIECNLDAGQRESGDAPDGELLGEAIGGGLGAGVSSAVNGDYGGATGADDAIRDFARTPDGPGGGLPFESLKEIAVFFLLGVHHLSAYCRKNGRHADAFADLYQ